MEEDKTKTMRGIADKTATEIVWYFVDHDVKDENHRDIITDVILSRVRVFLNGYLHQPDE